MNRNSIRKSVVAMMLALGVLFTSVAPSAFAQDRGCRQRRYDSRYDSGYNVSRYDRGRSYDSRSYDDRDYYYRDREDTTGNAVKRTGVGAAIGAVGGGLLGGKKGAVIGAAAGAAGGYLYHRNKVSRERDRYRY